jgi:UDP-2-acetamido-2-deoxy-ribo-hexuluronate aminotransferase
MPMSVPLLDLDAQYRPLRDQLLAAITRVCDSQRFIMGPEIDALERELSAQLGVTHAIAVSSGTDALLLALMALGIKAGDEVVTTTFSFFATAGAIVRVGATPVLVDIDPATFNIDPAQAAAAITPRTKAIMPVSLYGQCADFDAINAIARKRSLPVIEDGAQSFGALYRGKRSCGVSTIGSTSFFPSKPLGAYGDGGALFTDDDNLAKLMREIRVHGQDRRYHHPRLGLNGRLDTLQAAILLAKLDIFDDEVAARSRIGARYSQLIKAAIPAVSAPGLSAGCTSVYAQYTVEVPQRAKVEEAMKARGIPTAVHYPIPLHLQPVFANLGYKVGDFPVSEKAGERVMSLPMHPYLSDADQDKVVQALKESVTN